MTLAEFKAWFEGFTEDMDGAPDAKQWKRIKARVKEIDGVAVTKTVFIDRYVTPYRPHWSSFDLCGVGSPALGVGAISQNATSSSHFDGASAMVDLGKAEYKAALAS